MNSCRLLPAMSSVSMTADVVNPILAARTYGIASEVLYIRFFSDLHDTDYYIFVYLLMLLY